MNPTLWLVACTFGVAVLAILAIPSRRAAAARELEPADELLSEKIAAADRSCGAARDERSEAT
jgi:hypothetical protein